MTTTAGFTAGSTAGTNERIRDQFGASAAAYAVSAVHTSGPDLLALVEAAAVRGTERVLDMGSGAGHTALKLAAEGAAEVIGVDMTPEMVGVASKLAADRGLANARFELGDVSRLGFDDASFDIVTSRYSAHHYADPAAALREAHRLLKPGGRFLLVDCVAPEDPALDTFLQVFEFLRDGSHVRDWRPSEWLRMLAAASLPATVAYRGEVVLDGADWVKRMQTPPAKTEMIRAIFSEATDQQKRAFDIRSDPWGHSIPTALFVGVKPA